MANQLNINRCWFHNCRRPHYDIPKRRIQEIQDKCTVLTTRELFLKISSQT